MLKAFVEDWQMV